MRRARRACVALIAAASIAGCGGGKAKSYEESPSRSMQARPQPEPVPQTWLDDGDAARARIEALDHEIAGRAAALGLEPLRSGGPGGEPGTGADVRPGAGTSPMTEPPGTSALATCERSRRPVCQDVCSLADAICDAAEQICQIAAALRADDWATGRCSAGRSSCARARVRCCGC